VNTCTGQPRPPRRCPCGNGKLYLRCHAEKEERIAAGEDPYAPRVNLGAELEDRDYCPCKDGSPKSGKLYGRAVHFESQLTRSLKPPGCNP
jgi:hypothetical protein